MKCFARGWGARLAPINRLPRIIGKCHHISSSLGLSRTVPSGILLSPGHIPQRIAPSRLNRAQSIDECTWNDSNNHWNHDTHSRRQLEDHGAPDSQGSYLIMYNSGHSESRLLFDQWNCVDLERAPASTFSYVPGHMVASAAFLDCIPGTHAPRQRRSVDQVSFGKQNCVLHGGRDRYYDLRCGGCIASNTMVDGKEFKQNAKPSDHEDEERRPAFRAVESFCSSGCGQVMESRPVKNSDA